MPLLKIAFPRAPHSTTRRVLENKGPKRGNKSQIAEAFRCPRAFPSCFHTLQYVRIRTEHTVPGWDLVYPAVNDRWEGSSTDYCTRVVHLVARPAMATIHRCRARLSSSPIFSPVIFSIVFGLHLLSILSTHVDPGNSTEYVHTIC